MYKGVIPAYRCCTCMKVLYLHEVGEHDADHHEFVNDLEQVWAGQHTVLQTTTQEVSVVCQYIIHVGHLTTRRRTFHTDSQALPCRTSSPSHLLYLSALQTLCVDQWRNLTYNKGGGESGSVRSSHRTVSGASKISFTFHF